MALKLTLLLTLLLLFLPDKVATAKWVGDCFIYTNAAQRLNYCVGGEVITLAHFDRPLFLLGYLPKDNRLFLVDKDYAIIR